MKIIVKTKINRNKDSNVNYQNNNNNDDNSKKIDNSKSKK